MLNGLFGTHESKNQVNADLELLRDSVSELKRVRDNLKTTLGNYSEVRDIVAGSWEGDSAKTYLSYMDLTINNVGEQFRNIEELIRYSENRIADLEAKLNRNWFEKLIGAVLD